MTFGISHWSSMTFDMIEVTDSTSTYDIGLFSLIDSEVLAAIQKKSLT